MNKIKLTLSFGYPLKTYVFTGEYQRALQGFYTPERDQNVVFVPIYVDQEGNKVIDMTQVREKGE